MPPKNVYICVSILSNDMDRLGPHSRHQSNNKSSCGIKIRELYSKGFNKSQIAFQLGLHRSTVRGTENG